MAFTPAGRSGSGNIRSLPNVKNKLKNQNACRRNGHIRKNLTVLAAAILLSPLILVILAQGAPQVVGVDPSSGKVNDSVTVSGENLAKGSVSSVFLSDDKEDFKAAIVEQSAEKIVVKIPQVKSGNYNISIQVGDKILIKPVRFKVQE